MLEFDKHQNLLMQAKYRYSLQDVAEPNLYREIYDYKSIPKIAFNMRHVPEEMPHDMFSAPFPTVPPRTSFPL